MVAVHWMWAQAAMKSQKEQESTAEQQQGALVWPKQRAGFRRAWWTEPRAMDHGVQSGMASPEGFGAATQCSQIPRVQVVTAVAGGDVGREGRGQQSHLPATCQGLERGGQRQSVLQ